MASNYSSKRKISATDPGLDKIFNHPELEMALRKALIEARKRAGLTQKQVAEKLGTTQSGVARLERVGPMPSMTSLIKYASATNSRLRIFLEPEKPGFEKDKLSDAKISKDDLPDIKQVEYGWNELRDQLKDLKKKHMHERQVINQRSLYMDDTHADGDESLPDGNIRYREILEHSFDIIYRLNLDTERFDYVSPASIKDWRLSPEEILSRNPRTLLSALHPEDCKKVVKQYEDFISDSRKGKGLIVEYRAKLEKGKGYRWLSQTSTLIFDESDKAVAIVGNVRDITDLKMTEEKLLALVDQLDKKVKKYVAWHEEKNTALKVLLQQYQDEKTEIEEKILFNVKELILPMVKKLKHARLNDIQKYMDILEANLDQITSSFSTKVTSRHLNLSHQELQVSNYIIHGKTSKEIAELMGLSNRTIDFHRANIRKKLGLTNKKDNLRTHLLSLQ